MVKRIFVTGDTHGDRDKLRRIIAEKSLSKGDVLIVAGDFGFIMQNTDTEDMFLDEVMKLTEGHIAFVQGNHEHFPRIFEHPEIPYYGGRALKIRDNIFCLLNGEVFTFPTEKGDRSFFVMGGGASVDKGVNPFRYATVWLMINKSKGIAEIVCRDDMGYKARVEGYTPLTQRGICRRLTDEVYRSLEPLVTEHMPNYAGVYQGVSYVNKDTLRFTQAVKIRTVIENLVLSRFDDVRQDFFEAVFKGFEAAGAEGDSVRFVLTEGTWFEEEIPSDKDYGNASANLKKHGMKVDYILSHTMPQSMIIRHGYYPYHKDRELTGFLDWLMHDCRYKMQYCGHWHEDTAIGDKLTLLFKDVVEIQ